MKPQRPPATQPPCRSTHDRWLLGVCGGLAAHFETKSWIVRALWVASILITVGLSVIAYFVLARLMPPRSDD